MFSADVFFAEYDFLPKNGPVPVQPVGLRLRCHCREVVNIPPGPDTRTAGFAEEVKNRSRLGPCRGMSSREKTRLTMYARILYNCPQ